MWIARSNLGLTFCGLVLTRLVLLVKLVCVLAIYGHTLFSMGSRVYSVRDMFNIGYRVRAASLQPPAVACASIAEHGLIRSRGCRAGRQRLHGDQLLNRVNYANLTQIPIRRHSLINANCATVNARSARKSAGHLRQSIFYNDLDILTITETWLRHNDEYESLKICPAGYSLVRADRDGHAGGIATLCRDEFKPKSIKDVVYPSFEHDVVAVTTDSHRTLIVTIYRPPRLSISDFHRDFTSLLEELASDNLNIIITGDFNIHFDNASDPKVREFCNILEAFSLIQRVKSSTHNKGHILDLVITRENNALSCSDPIIGELFSDHHMVLFQINTSKPKVHTRKVTYREIQSIDIASFIDDIRESELMNHSDKSLHELTTLYNSELARILDNHAPVVERVFKQKRNDPWYTHDVMVARTGMRKAERRYRKNHTDENHSIFVEKRDHFRHLLHSSESDYFTNLISENVGDSRKLFRAINGVMLRKKSNPMPDYKNPGDMANQFSDFFTSKIDNIRASFPNSPIDNAFTYDRNKDITVPLHQFSQVTTKHIARIVSKSKDASCELDPIPTPLVKKCLHVLSPVLTRIVNLSITTSCMPDMYKSAIVRPLLKKDGLDKECKNYRPVSNLSFVSKLIENVVNKQMVEHLDANRLSEPLQSAYRRYHSTETALVKVFDDILTAVDAPGGAVFMAMLDLSAAFDTVDHEILLKRLEVTMGVNDAALNWFKSYLTNRSMKVCVESVYSASKSLSVAVPQGSQGGPQLYSDYTQPLGELIRTIRLLYHMYADDTQLMKTATISTLSAQMDACHALANGVNAIQEWMMNNRLKINPEKTEFIVLTSAWNRKKVMVNEIQFGDVTIQRTDCVRNLGVHMDSTLSLDVHVAQVCKVCYYYISWIRKIRHTLSVDTCKLIIHALVISRLDYCNALLYGLPDAVINKLQRVMNLAARVTLQIPRDSSARQALARLHWLPIRQRITFKVSVLVFRSLNGCAPEYLSNLLSMYEPPRALRKRKHLQLQTKDTRTKSGDRSFSAAGPVVWNGLPTYVKEARTERVFRARLKTFLFENAFIV